MKANNIQIRYPIFILLAINLVTTCRAQFALYDTTEYNARGLKKKVIVAGTVYTAGLIGLNEIWYKENPRQSFRFFNDSREWKQVDKVGHFYSSFYLSALSGRTLNKSGLKSLSSSAIGSVTGWVALSAIEILDGHSAAYGASSTDLLANLAGSSFYFAQALWWKDIRIYPKFSFSPTSLAQRRPNVLGDNFASQILKDYNGQTYWLSVDVNKFTRFPKWLNIAVGYGAQNMVYANDLANEQAGFASYRQYYLALDFDLTGIKTNSKFLKGLFVVLSGIRLPAPALEFNPQSIRFYPLYF